MKQKHLLKSLLLLLALMVGSSAWAEDTAVTFDLSTGTNQTSMTSVSSGDVTITFAKGTGSTAPTWYSNGNALRFYSGNTITFASTGGKITKVELTNTESQVVGGDNGANFPSEGTYSNNNKVETWIPTEPLASFTVNITNKPRLSKIVVYLGPSTVCATPTFSPAAGAVPEGTEVTISSSTSGATIYYTTDKSTPSATNGTQGTTVTINEETTIKAIAVKDGMNDSEVATAEYTIKQVVRGYTIDFESDITSYVDWTFENVGNANTAITAHGGSKYGANINDSGNGTASLSIQTKEAVALPGALTCYVSKVSNNTTASTWKVSVSSDGADWTEVATQDAKSMSKGEWVEFTANLSSYSDVYVRITYGSSNAIRAIDDITLTERDPNGKVTPTIVIDATALTTDLAGETNVSAGTAIATVMDGQTEVENVSVTWSSSNTDVATIDETTGAVTLIATGTTTLTATFAGNDDYNEATGTYILTVNDSQGPGSKDNPFTVAEAIEAITNGTFDANTFYYVSGIISQVKEVNTTQYYNATYFISDDGQTTTQLEVYRGKYLANANFTSADQIQEGDKVVVYGKLIYYNNETPEIAQGNYIVSLNRKEVKYYLAGSWGENNYGWGEGMEQLTKNGDTYTITKNLANGTLFKIVKVDETNNNETTWYGGPADGEWFGVSSNVCENLTLSDPGKNFKIEGDCDDNFTFTVDATDPDNLKLTVTGWHVPVVKYYLAGNWTENWGDGKVELTENADGTFSCSKLVGNGSRFKFVKAVDGAETWYGATQTGNDYGIHSEWCTNIELSDNGNASAFVVQMASDRELTFTLNADDLKFSVTGWPISIAGNLFVKVTSSDDFTDGAYLIVNEDASVAFDGSLETLDAANNVIKVKIVDNTIVANSTTKESLFTIVNNGKITSASGHYIGVKKYENSLIVDDAATMYTNSVTFDSEGNAIIAINTGTSGDVNLKYNKASDQNRFRYYKSGQQNIQLYKLVTATEIPVAVSGAGYATYCSENALDLSAVEGLTAYKATITDNKVSFIEVEQVPAGEGVLLKGTQGTYEVPVIASAAELEDNEFIGVTKETKVEEKGIFVLMNGDAGVGFYKTTADYFTVGANTAYLPATAGARSFIGFDFDNTTTAIKGVATVESHDGEVYNLQGQRVVKAQKGLYIINGKKVVLK